MNVKTGAETAASGWGDLRVGDNCRQIFIAAAMNESTSLGLLGDRARTKQIGQIAGVRGILQERFVEVEDFLHGTQIGRMREIDRAGVGHHADILMSMLRNDDLADGVAEVVLVLTRV